MLPFKHLYLLLLFLCLSVFSNGQNFLLASLQGSPKVNTNGWNLTGIASIGDTPGDANSDSDEVILCTNTTNQSGAIFYSQPINLAQCSRFKVSFDFRMFDGNSADGIAFCFIQNPPTGFVNGQGLGVPSNANGLIIGFDTFDNCGGPNPELQIRYPNYQECPTPSQPTVNGLFALRETNYRHADIVYNNGNIAISIDGVLTLSGSYNSNFTGYFGFTASTGALTDLHSIRNVMIYTQKAPVFAGNDVTICPSDTYSLGNIGLPGYNYQWLGDTSYLNNKQISSPLFTAPIVKGNPTAYQLIIKTDTTGIPCSSFDTVVITVKPKPDTLTLIKNTFCINEAMVLSVSAPLLGLINFQRPNGSIGSGQPGLQPPPNQNHVGVWRLWQVLNSCASDTTTVNVKIGNAMALPIFNGIATACVGDNFQWTGTPISNLDTIKWLTPKGLLRTGTRLTFAAFTLSDTGTYLLWATNNGCNSDTLRLPLGLKTFPAPSGLTQNQPACTNTQLMLNAAVTPNNAGFYWQSPLGTIYKGMPAYVSNPSSTLTGTWKAWYDMMGCISDTGFISVSVQEAPKPKLNENYTYCKELDSTPVVLNPGSFTQYNWSNNINTPTLEIAVPGKYTVTVTDAYGCKATAQTVVTEKCPILFQIPTAFTPNTDNYNELLQGVAVGIQSVSFKVYDRWGGLVYQFDSPEFNPSTFQWWNGNWQNNGKPLPQGQYVWMARVVPRNGDPMIFSGNTWLIR